MQIYSDYLLTISQHLVNSRIYLISVIIKIGPFVYFERKLVVILLVELRTVEMSKVSWCNIATLLLSHSREVLQKWPRDVLVDCGADAWVLWAVELSNEQIELLEDGQWHACRCPFRLARQSLAHLDHSLQG